jgi:hypothetical protein
MKEYLFLSVYTVLIQYVIQKNQCLKFIENIFYYVILQCVFTVSALQCVSQHLIFYLRAYIVHVA